MTDTDHTGTPTTTGGGEATIPRCASCGQYIDAEDGSRDLLAAARAALERLSRNRHDYSCPHLSRSLLAAMHNEPQPVEAEHCTCGLWQTREGLRRAIAKASGGTE